MIDQTKQQLTEATQALSTVRAAHAAAEHRLSEARQATHAAQALLEGANVALASEPTNREAIKARRAAAAGADDTQAVEAAIFQAVAESARAVSQAEVEHREVVDAEAAAERAADIARGGALLNEVLSLETRAAALRAEIDTIVSKHSAGPAVDTYAAGPAEVLNAIREGAGLPPLDWMGNPIAKSSQRAA